MIKTDEDALVCDLAETYHIFDYRQLPLVKVAVFAYGLPDKSRIKLKLNNLKVDLDTLLLATAVDRLSLLVWSKTVDGQKGRRQPKSLAQLLQTTEVDRQKLSFASGQEYEAVRARLIQGGGK
ncbi:DUF5361 domain-containing protein [Lapidilactobacillus wuchangensis]|uniref:DUF5361 domain-containing protein n=1 Tax=Lapidilactobacillus wuchangensis TaxID=2486001 RepID=UPI000F7A0C2F|nr:DUF5361 domain-containing protein [Lapidilactobacillus wuchangensis]